MESVSFSQDTLRMLKYKRMPLVRGAVQPFAKAAGYNGSGRPNGLTNQLCKGASPYCRMDALE